MLKKFSIWILVVVSVILLGTALISAVYLIDTDSLEENLIESKNVLKKEDVYEQISEEKTSILDNSTDSLMLLIASYRGEESLIDKGMSIYRVDVKGRHPHEQLIADDNPETRVISYSRYWHGYLIFLRPLLAFFNYGQIRIINIIVQTLLFVILIALMVKNNVARYIIPLLSAYIMINPIAIFMSLQNSTIWYITLVSLIIYLIFKNKIIENKLHYLMFTVVGMITSYMDFLTYPIVTLGILLIFVLITENLSFKDAIKRILISGTCWTLGYGIMWGAKWILATLIIGKDVIADAVGAVEYRSSNLTWGDIEISRFKTIKNVFEYYLNDTTKYVLAINALILTLIFVLNIRKYEWKLQLRNIVNTLPILGISLMTIVWYLVLANHTQIHPFLAFRTAFVLILSCLVTIYKSLLI